MALKISLKGRTKVHSISKLDIPRTNYNIVTVVHSVFLTTPRNFYPFQVIRNKIVRYQDQTVFLEYSCFSFSPRHFVIMNSCPELSILLNFAIIQTWLFYKSMNFISVYCDNHEISLTFLWWRQLRALNNRITTKLLLHCKMFNFSLTQAYYFVRVVAIEKNLL